MKINLRTLTCSALLALSSITIAHAASMSVSSTSFKDGQNVAMQIVGAEPACGSGQAQSPQVSWSNLPAGARSVAVVLFDPDGAKGLGVAHWLAYNVDAARGHLEQNEAAASIKGVTVGKNTTGAPAYKGLCPPAGDNLHHYVMTVIATDLAPGSIAEGLDHTGLLNALKGHTLAGQSVVGLYGH
jgi:Raf kinase inhibitor-like YbhB/YbcL family protein